MADFEARCDKEGRVTTFTEFMRERRAVQSDRAALAGDFRVQTEYSFRCKSCGLRTEKILDEAGILHKWQGNRHVTMHVGSRE